MTITDIIKDITAQICDCIGIDECRNFAIQRGDGMVYDGNRANGDYIGIDATQAPSGYVRIAGEIDLGDNALGSCKGVPLVTVPLVVVRWAYNQPNPQSLADGLLYALNGCRITGAYKPTITVESLNFVFDEILAEETNNPPQFPAGLTAAKASVTMRVRVPLCDLTAPACGPTSVVPPVVPNDEDAQALFDAIIADGDTLTETEMSAANTLIIGLKAANLWDASAIYLMIGGTSTAHRWNAKNPVDTDAAFRLSFTGGWTHDANGATPNGVNGYADTFFTPATNAPATSLSICYYSTSSAAGAYIEMGCNGNAGGANNGQTYIAPNLSGSQFRAVNSTGNNTGAGIVPSNFHVSARDVGTVRTYRAGSLVATDAQANTTSTRKMYLGARNNNGSANAFSARGCAFAAIYPVTLNDAQVATLYTLVEAAQTTLGRNVL